MPERDAMIGVYNCWSCGKEIPVWLKASGKMSAVCTWCKMPHYANAGTEHYDRLMAKVKKTAAPAAAPKKEEPAPPAPKKEEAPHFSAPLFAPRKS